MDNNSLHKFVLLTLVDITRTNVTRSGDQELERNQQRNWETVIQSIGIMAQPVYLEDPVVHNNVDLHPWMFGELYQGHPHKVWTMVFGVEHEDVFDLNTRGDHLRLDQCFDQVPVITGLTETARFMLPIFYTSGSIKNIYFIQHARWLNIL